MRLVAFGLALALGAASANPALAQPGAPPLAPGELLVELGSIGTATVQADLATITVAFAGTGATEAAAQADLEPRYRAVVAAARRFGVPANAISHDDFVVALRTFDVREEPPPPPEEPPPPPGDMPVAAEAQVQPPVPSSYANGSVTIQVTDMARIADLRLALDAAAGTEAGNAQAIYSLTDDRAARRAARAQALAAVRAEAEAYAAALNMRIARMVRVTERTGVDLLPHLFSGEPWIVRQAFSGPHREPDITVFVAVGADFVLAPR